MPDPLPPDARLARWTGLAKGRPPEWLAAFIASPSAAWSVVTEDGPERKRVTRTAYLDDPADVPCWAFVTAKAYLDDVGEWPVYGLATEAALDAFEQHGDIERAVRDIISSVQPVWPELIVKFVGEEKR